MEKEKGVIVDEMASYRDNPEESIMDDYEDLIFKRSGLGHNILGLEKDLLAFTRADVQQFIHQNYQTNDIVIGITGDYELKTVEKMLRRYFEPVKENKLVRTRQDVPFVNGSEHIELKKPINQVHFMLGAP